MEKTVKSKNILKIVLAVMCLAVVAATSALVTAIVCEGKEAPTVSEGEEVVNVKLTEVDNSAKNAGALFECKVDDINDTASVAKLLEAIGLEGITGKYTVRIDKADGIHVMMLNIDEVVEKADKENFDYNVQLCAEQVLALVTDVRKVVWEYGVVTKDSKEESALISIDTAGAEKELGKDVKSLGKSADTVKNLLTIQKGRKEK